MITLSDLRRALEQALTHPENPAILRLPEGERTAEGVARTYLAGVILGTMPHGGPILIWPHDVPSEQEARIPLRLVDPGTCHAVLVVLALALWLDPGAGGLDVRWKRLPCGWMIQAGDRVFRFGDRTPPPGCHDVADRDIFHAPSIATAPDPIKALSAALLHVCPRPE